MNDIKTITEWHTPATDYEIQSYGEAQIYRVKYKGYYHGNYVTDPDGGGPYNMYRCPKAIPVTTLDIEGETWMVDDPPHWWRIQQHAATYHGHVLVAGLGLGLIVWALNMNPQVKRITVVERNLDVINMVGSLVPKQKLLIIHHGDFFNLPIFRHDKYDGVFFDLFVGEGLALFGKALRVMAELRKEYPSADPIHILGFSTEMLRQVSDEIYNEDRRGELLMLQREMDAKKKRKRREVGKR